MSVVQRAILRMLTLAPTHLPPPGTVAAADLRTSMCDARVAVCLALGRACDVDGYALPEPGQLPLWGEAA